MPTSQTPLASGTTNDAELIQAFMRALQAAMACAAMCLAVVSGIQGSTLACVVNCLFATGAITLAVSD